MTWFLLFFLGSASFQARKMFREIDVDASGEISRNEFVSAIGLSEPSLFLEDLRKKVRQRFRSFKAQFADAFQDSALNDCASAPRLVLKHFQELLLPLSMSEKETKVLFNLIDIDHDGRLSIREFVKGVRHFAPASVLEDLRVRCCQQHDRISDPFVTIDYNQLFNSMSFAQKMLDPDFILKEGITKGLGLAFLRGSNCCSVAAGAAGAACYFCC